MKACRKARICLRREIAVRNLVIETLCYRHEIRNQMDGGHNRAQIRAGQLLASARKGTLDRVQVPPRVRLLIELEKAYYDLPGRISMAHMNDKPFPPRVYEDARKAAELVAKGAAPESLDVDE
jgi:hypothetical protein